MTAASDMDIGADAATAAAVSAVLFSYPGGKSGAGVAQQIAGLFLPHVVYVELFLGHGGVFRHKRPAFHSYGYDTNPDVIARWKHVGWPGLSAINGCGVAALERWQGDLASRGPHNGPVVIYADPPYPHSVRSRLNLYGEHEWDVAMHSRFLAAAVACREAAIYVSTYENEQYTAALEPAGFRRHQFQAMTRGGVRTETVWYRIPPTMQPTWGPLATAPGRDYREREKFKRRNDRWVRMFKAMPREQRTALLGQLIDAHGEGSR